MSRIKLVSIVLVSVFLVMVVILIIFCLLSDLLFDRWAARLFSNQQNNTQSVTCSFPTSADMASLDKHEATKQASLRCLAFEEAKLQYEFDPSNTLTWDNAFPSREDWAKRLKVFKKASNGIWSTYNNEKYDLAFNFPPDWNVMVSAPNYHRDYEYQIILTNPGSQLIRPMVIKIQDYSFAPEGLISSSEWVQTNDGILLTKLGLIEKKKQIENAARVADSYGKFVMLSNDYSTSEYHNFYRHGEFFIGNNLITVTQPLSIRVPDIAGWQKEQQELLAKINSGSANELVAAEIKLTDLIVDSFRQNSLFPGD